MYFFISCIFLLIILYIVLNRYIKLATKLHIFSLEEKGSLHSGKRVRGGGIIFGLIFCIFILVVPETMAINKFYLKPLLLCALFCLVLGFIDDLINIKILYKFFFQFLVSSILVFYFYEVLS